MATIIGCDDIYNVSSYNILSNNRIDGVSYQNKDVVVDDSLNEAEVYTGITETDDGVLFTDNNSDFSVATQIKSASGYGYTWHYYSRVEAYYSTFTFPINKTYNITKNDLIFKSNVEVVDNETPARTSLDFDQDTLKYMFNGSGSSEMALFTSADMFGDVSTGTIEGLIGDGEPYVTSEDWGSGIGTTTAKQTLTETINIEEYTDEEITADPTLSDCNKVTVRFPTKVSGVYGWITNNTELSDSHVSKYGGNYYPYQFTQITSIDVYLQYTKVTVSDGGRLIKVGSFDSTSNTFSLETNSLIQATTSYTPDNQQIGLHNATEIYNAWVEGRESVDIDVMIGEFYDEVGTLVISTEEENLPMTFNVGDLVIPYTVDENGIESPLSIYKGASPLIFSVYATQIYYDGACWQKLSLIEAKNLDIIAITLELEDGVEVTITRVSSSTEGANTGELKALFAYKGDVLTFTFSYTGDSKYYNLIFEINGSSYEEGQEFSVDEDITIRAEATSFYSLTWEQIDEICSEGLVEDYFSVGDEKVISIDEGLEEIMPTEHTVVILGINHDELSDGTGTASLTIGMVDCLSTSYTISDSTKSKWSTSTFRTSTLETLLTQLPEDLQSIIKPVNKYTQEDGTLVTNIDKLFLLSPIEIMDELTLYNVFGSSGWEVYYDFGVRNEGTQYEYWKSVKNGDLSSDRIKTHWWANYPPFQEVCTWWTRTDFSKSSLSYSNWGFISSSGDLTYMAPTASAGVSLAFCVGQESVDIDLGSSTWEQISKISESGTASQYFSIGDTKTIELSDGETLVVRIIAFDHDTLSDGSSTVGITFESVGVLKDDYVFNSSSEYLVSLGDATIVSETFANIKNRLPSDLQDVIKTIRKKSSYSIDTSTEEITQNYIHVDTFMLSSLDIFGSTNSAAQYFYDGVYDYYNGNTSSSSLQKSVYGETAFYSYWLLEATYSWTDSKEMAYIITEDGELSTDVVTNENKIAICFCV